MVSNYNACDLLFRVQPPSRDDSNLQPDASLPPNHVQLIILQALATIEPNPRRHILPGPPHYDNKEPSRPPFLNLIIKK